MDEDRVELFDGLFLVAANGLGEGVLDGEVVVQELAVGVGHDAFSVFGLRGLERRRNAGIVRIESGLGNHRQKIAPVVAARLTVERGRNGAVVRCGLRVKHLEERLVEVVILRWPGLGEVSMAGIGSHLNGEPEAVEREEVVAGMWPGRTRCRARRSPGRCGAGQRREPDAANRPRGRFGVEPIRQRLVVVMR